MSVNTVSISSHALIYFEKLVKPLNSFTSCYHGDSVVPDSEGGLLVIKVLALSMLERINDIYVNNKIRGADTKM